MFFRSRRKREIREYMKFEDGKIISIAVEQNPPPPPFEQPMPKETNAKTHRETIKEKAKAWFTVKNLKYTTFICVFIMFLYALYDVYQTFFVTDAEESDPIITEEVQNSPNNNSDPTNHVTEKNQNLQKENENLAGNTRSKENKTVPNEPAKEEKQEESEAKTDPIYQLLTFTNETNQQIIEISKDEIKYVQDYFTKKASYIGLKNRLNKSFQQKTDIYKELQSYQNLYREHQMAGLYAETENRVKASLNFTGQIQSLLDRHLSSDIQAAISKYAQEDEAIQKQQTKALIQFLKKHNIPYVQNGEQIQVLIKE